MATYADKPSALVSGGPRTVKTASIANAGSLSAVVDLDDMILARINMPAAWTAAVLTFQTSADNVTFRNMYDASGNEVSYTVSTDRSVTVNPADWVGVRYMKVRSGTLAAPVNQSAARAIELVVVP